ncbi:hypothetical protein DB30_03970 [Enhygromyxa salina]|uniref:Uncharacterized protein n=1 Tax=Enhygromyxa salina TaxID=215803 RepID=A0A0C2A0B4_9BACT|nr:hypothetical protein DB30_03970 [Enhygromyxa salina]
MDWRRWVLGDGIPVPPRRFMALSKPPERGDWRDPDVGWGLILPYGEDLDEAAAGRVEDAPEPIQRLFEHRSQPNNGRVQTPPLFRWHPSFTGRYHRLRRYYPDGRHEDLSIVGSSRGVGIGKIPEYLLICASPKRIPWSLQFVLNGAMLVGRLDLSNAGIDNYVSALIDDWSDAKARPDASLVWSAFNGSTDLGRLARDTIAVPVVEGLRTGPELGAGLCFMDGRDDTADVAALMSTLAMLAPGLIVTTSHGYTNPADNHELTGASLGTLVDANREKLETAALLTAWSPEGAIWYAHACCSAGSEGRNRYAGLVAKDRQLDRMLEGIAALGDHCAPLPRALLAAERPLRAFVGHVQPTFDWSLRERETSQPLTGALTHALTDELYRLRPVAMAFRRSFHDALILHTLYEQTLRDYNNGNGDLGLALALRLTAIDRSSMVVLGDPTVTLAPEVSPE